MKKTKTIRDEVREILIPLYKYGWLPKEPKNYLPTGLNTEVDQATDRILKVVEKGLPKKKDYNNSSYRATDMEIGGYNSAITEMREKLRGE